jgi:hypothetical protein
MKPFAFVLVSALVLAAIYAYAAPTYGGRRAQAPAWTRFRSQLRRSDSPREGAGVSAETGSAILVTATTLSCGFENRHGTAQQRRAPDQAYHIN